MEGPASTWQCESTLAGHSEGIFCLATWGGKVARGSHDKTIRVWDVGTGTHAGEQTLDGHAGSIFALVACGQRLISSSVDKTVKVWSVATWACMQTVQAYPAGSAQYIECLAVSGPTLTGGSSSVPAIPVTEEHEARIWDRETLEPLLMVRLPAGEAVIGLASDGGEVCGVVGNYVMVWVPS